MPAAAWLAPAPAGPRSNTVTVARPASRQAMPSPITPAPMMATRGVLPIGLLAECEAWSVRRGSLRWYDPDRFDGFDLSRCPLQKGGAAPRADALMMGVLRPFGKPRPLPPMPQEPRANESNDHDHAGAEDWRGGQAEIDERKADRQHDAAKAEPGNDDAGVGRMGLAAGEQQERHIRKHAVDNDAFEEHRAKADLGPRIGEHAAIAGHGGCKVERLCAAVAQPAKCKERDDRDDHTEAADREEYTAPAEQVANHARNQGADEVAGKPDRQDAANRNLPLVHRHKIADDGHAHRKDAARAYSGDNPHHHKQREIAGEGTDQRRGHHRGEAQIHQPGFAEKIPDRAQGGLGEGVRERERAR